jgi:molybdate/tungstate transport system ATP-binding protein
MSAGLAVEALTLTLGTFHLKKIDFAVSAGETLVILGPNGAGKSVTLETIAGFHRPDSGRVLIAGSDVTARPPERRHVGFVVQNFGLFPHLSVAQNVAIARRRDRALPAPIAALPSIGDDAALLGYFGVAHLAQRAPADLSPGEKQRVALARALVGAPEVFLFDEPFSALDAQARGQLREELQSFLRALAIPSIFVTHDRTDALVLGDTIAVLRDGAIEQSDTATAVFRRPVNSFVARFVGAENVLPGRIVETSGNIMSVEVGKRIVRSLAPAKLVPTGSSVMLSIRAEDATLCAPQAGAAASPTTNRLEGRLTGLRSEGALVTLSIDCGFPLKSYLLAPQARAMNLSIGGAVTVAIAAEAIHVMAD